MLHGSSVLANESDPYELLANIPLVMQPPVVLGLAVIITLVCPVVTVEKINSVDTNVGIRGTIPSLVGGPGKIGLAVPCPASLVRPPFYEYLFTLSQAVVPDLCPSRSPSVPLIVLVRISGLSTLNLVLDLSYHEYHHTMSYFIFNTI
jgi:hypothetical protein